MHGDRIYSGIFGVACLVALVAVSLFVLTADMRRVLSVIPDDAAYYFKIAANAAAGKGLTFDGLERTNGFQPLWLYLLVILSSIRRWTPEALCRASLVLQLAFLVCAAFLMHSMQARFFSRRTALVSGLMFLFFVLVPAANGMESAILVFFVVLLFFFGWKAEVFERRDARRHFILGALLGFVMLSRLDMVFLAAVLFACLFARAWKEKGRSAAVALAAFVAGAVVVVLPYLLYNRLSFGSVAPINAVLKSSFPRITGAAHAFSKLGKRDWIGLAAALGYLGWFGARFSSLKESLPRRLFFQGGLAIMAGTVLLHFLHTLLFMKWAVFSWHFIPYSLFATAAACEPVDRLLRTRRVAVRNTAYGVVAAGVILAGCVSVERNVTVPLDRNWRPVAYEAALWARRNTDPNAIFAMKDAGNFGYFSERRVINLDGVVNGFPYQKILRDKKLGLYLREEGVQYIVQHAFWNRPDVLSGAYGSYSMSYLSHQYETSSDAIELARGDEAFRSKPYFDGPYQTVFLIWRFR